MNTMKLFKKELKLEANMSMYIWFFCVIGFYFIPSYPVYIGPYYLTLSVMMTFALNQVSNGMLYTVLLPVRKIDTVKARFLYCAFIESSFIPFAIIAGIIRNSEALGFPANNAGIGINVAYIGLELILLAVFNLIYLGRVYKDPLKPGLKFLFASIVYFLFYVLCELPVWIYNGKMKAFVGDGLSDVDAAMKINSLPWFDPSRIGQFLKLTDFSGQLSQLPILIVGLLFFVLSFFIAFRFASRQFEKYDM
ncbi:MAG: ABC-2 transporter permease [Treponemataceae bacterium]|nr:ABC-2 transporter permease [Treponemataceae bacterium]